MENTERRLPHIASPDVLMQRGIQHPADIVARVWGEEATRPYRDWLIASIRHENATKWDSNGRIRDDYQPLEIQATQAETRTELPFPTQDFTA